MASPSPGDRCPPEGSPEVASRSSLTSGWPGIQRVRDQLREAQRLWADAHEELQGAGVAAAELPEPGLGTAASPLKTRLCFEEGLFGVIQTMQGLQELQRSDSRAHSVASSSSEEPRVVFRPGARSEARLGAEARLRFEEGLLGVIETHFKQLEDGFEQRLRDTVAQIIDTTEKRLAERVTECVDALTEVRRVVGEQELASEEARKKHALLAADVAALRLHVAGQDSSLPKLPLAICSTGSAPFTPPDLSRNSTSSDDDYIVEAFDTSAVDKELPSIEDIMALQAKNLELQAANDAMEQELQEECMDTDTVLRCAAERLVEASSGDNSELHTLPPLSSENISSRSATRSSVAHPSSSENISSHSATPLRSHVAIPCDQNIARMVPPPSSHNIARMRSHVAILRPHLKPLQEQRDVSAVAAQTIFLEQHHVYSATARVLSQQRL